MWLKAPFGLEQVAGSLTRTFTNAPAFVVGDFPLLLQPENTSAQTSKITANMQNSALLRMAEPRPDRKGVRLQEPWERIPSDMEHSSFRFSGRALIMLQHLGFRFGYGESTLRK